jgi:ribosomal protein L30E
VVSQIEDPDEFWQLNQADAKRVEDRIASIDVKALLAFDLPANFQEGEWMEIGPIDGKPFSVLLLQPAKDPSR